MDAKLLHSNVVICPSSSAFINSTNKSYVHRKSFVKYSVSGDYRRNLTILAVKTTSIDRCASGNRERLGSFNGLERKGLGIVDFLKGKNLLVTGATGFLAKVVIEKILRTQPDVGKLFLLIRAKDSESAFKRLKEEILYSELFKCLRDLYGDEFEEFVLKKLVPIVGDVSVDNIGIQADVSDKLVHHVDVILNSSANTTFDERFDVAIETNTKGPSRLMEFAKRCRNLQVFLHVSTAYVNGARKGIVLEQPFQMAHSIARELETQDAPLLDIFEEFELTKKSINDLSNDVIDSKSSKNNVAQRMKDLGLKRAKKHGWHDVYAFTKAMGEMLLGYNRGQIPLAVVRPSVIEGSYSDPFPGWIEGLRMVDPVIACYGKGQLSAVVGDPDVALDIIPVDVVANAILAAMTKQAGRSGLEVYHVGSSATNPIMFGELFTMFFEFFKGHPYVDERGKLIEVEENLKFYGSMEDLANMRNGMRARDYVNKRISQVYEFYLTYNGRFDTSNTEGLLKELSVEESIMFGFDAKRIEWRDYIMKVHIPGLLRYVLMKGRPTST